MNSQKSYKKPYYKKMFLSRKNVTNDLKIFFFKKKKWEKFNFFSKKQLKFWKRFRFKDQFVLRIDKFASKGNSFKKFYRDYLTKQKIIQTMYGDFKRKAFKKVFSNRTESKMRAHCAQKEVTEKNANSTLLTLFGLEQRLDIVLHRAKFSCSINQAKQIISHGHVFVNNVKTKANAHLVQLGDSVTIKKTLKSREIIRQNLTKNTFWPLPPNFLKINYKTLTILNQSSSMRNPAMFFSLNLNINSLKNSARFK